MNCYHCKIGDADLKCGYCDSEIFRFCSNQCGAKAHAIHAEVCYDRKNLAEVESHLFDAIERMQDTEEIDDAMDLASDIALFREIEGEDDHLNDLMEEAHEMIQSHLMEIGDELIEAGPEAREARKLRVAAARAERKRKTRAKAAAKRARMEKDRLAGMQKDRLKGKSKMDRYARQQKRRQERLRKKQERLARKDQKVSKPGFRERMLARKEKSNETAAEREEQRARQALDNQGRSP